jgi:hypothetical protein
MHFRRQRAPEPFAPHNFSRSASSSGSCALSSSRISILFTHQLRCTPWAIPVRHLPRSHRGHGRIDADFAVLSGISRGLSGGDILNICLNAIQNALRARKLLAEVEERELRLAVKKGEYVALSEVRETWTKLISRAKDLLRNKFEMELPPILSGLDTTGIQAECRRAIDEVLTLLHTPGGGIG